MQQAEMPGGGTLRHQCAGMSVKLGAVTRNAHLSYRTLAIAGILWIAHVVSRMARIPLGMPLQACPCTYIAAELQQQNSYGCLHAQQLLQQLINTGETLALPDVKQSVQAASCACVQNKLNKIKDRAQHVREYQQQHVMQSTRSTLCTGLYPPAPIADRT
jgi:hypothetical protein